MKTFPLLASILFVSLSPAAHAEPAPRVFYVNSYHEGYGSSDDVMTGIRDVLGEAGVELRVAFLDAKRNPEAADLEARAAEVLARIRAFRPGVLLVSDDAAAKYLVVPHFREGPLPVVFCGVNNSCEPYGLPTPFVTGMVEVIPIGDTLASILPFFPGARDMTILTEDSTSARANQALMEPLYRKFGLEPTTRRVAAFDAWKTAFVQANDEADVIYLPTNGAIRGWDHEGAMAWVREHIRVPVVTCDDFMMPYAVFGKTKVAREQGTWAAETALNIIAGLSPVDIPVTRNRRTRIYFNPVLGRAIDFVGNRNLLPPHETIYLK